MILEPPDRLSGLQSDSKDQNDREDETDEISFILIFRLLKLGRHTILLVMATALLVSTTAAFLLPAQYTSVCAIIPPTSSSNSSAAALAGQLSALGGAGGLLGPTKSPADLYVGILKSHSIAEEIVKRFNLRSLYKEKKESAAEKKLADNTQFDVGTKDSIIKLSVTDRNPARAQEIARVYLDILRATNDRLAISESSQRRLFFEQRLAEEKDNLANAEVELRRTEEQSGLIAPSGQTASEIQAIGATRAQVAAREVELAALRQSSTEENPELIRLKSEIANLHDQLARLQAGKSKELGGVIPTSMVPGLQLDYVRKEREVKYHESLFEILGRQYEAARLDEAHNAPVLQVLDPPSYPDVKSSPHRTLIVLGGVALGFLSGCCWVLIIDYIRAVRAKELGVRQQNRSTAM